MWPCNRRNRMARPLTRLLPVLLAAPLVCRAQGVITTVAGTGNNSLLSGGIGDGGPATKAFVESPSAVAVDTAGNLYIWDSTLYRIRKVNPAGIISTVVGTGNNGSA